MASKREVMPTVASWIDGLRVVFGREGIDGMIKQGLRADCEPRLRFHAKEGGHELGRPYQEGTEVDGAHLVIRDPDEEAALMKRLKRR